MDSAYLIGAIVGSLVAGMIFGAIPCVLGYKKGKKGLGIAGFITCTVGSFIAGMFLSIPCCIIFTVIILLTSKNSSGANGNGNN